MKTKLPRHYLTLVEEFNSHWTQVNTALGTALTLSGSYNIGQLDDDRTALQAKVAAVIAADNTAQGAGSDRDIKRALLKGKLTQFNAAVRAFWPKSRYESMLPTLPDARSASEVWFQAMEDCSNVWGLINAITPVPVGMPIPLLLPGTYAKATFETDRTALVTAFNQVKNARNLAETLRGDRNALWGGIHERLRQYRQAVVAKLPVDSPLIASLPALTPPAGHTPLPVNVSALWDATSNKAVLNFSSSPDADLQEYEVRACFGTKYNTAEEVVLGTVAPGPAPLNFATDQGLVASGSRVFYKVYVILKTDNEKGSKSVSVTRP